MTKRIERIVDVKEVKKGDNIIYKYSGKVERYTIQSMDKTSLKAVTEEGKAIRISPLATLVTDSWYVERERGSYERNKTL